MSVKIDMCTETENDCCQIIKKWRPCEKAIIQARMLSRLAVATVIDYPYGSSGRVFLHWMVRDVVGRTLLVRLWDHFDKAST